MINDELHRHVNGADVEMNKCTMKRSKIRDRKGSKGAEGQCYQYVQSSERRMGSCGEEPSDR